MFRVHGAPAEGHTGLLVLLLGLALLGAMAAATMSPLVQAADDGVHTGKASASSQQVASPTATCQSAWSLMTSPALGGSINVLESVAALSSNDIWAVGSYTTITISRAIAQHWNGSAWMWWRHPTTCAYNNHLYDVVALAPNDVWAVGGYVPSPLNGQQALTVHWDGTQWSVVPNPGTGGALYSVTAVSPSDIWAVGSELAFPRFGRPQQGASVR